VIENVEISLQARSKTGRYFGDGAIRAKLNALDGTLFRRDGGPFYLRTTQSSRSGPPKRIVIVFVVTESTAHVISQTSDHYDWAELEHIQNPPFCIELDVDTSRHFS